MSYSAVKPLASERNRMLEPGAQAHCKRVAAWCEELALALDVPCNEASALQEAALMHHHPLAFLTSSGAARLAGDLGFPQNDDVAIPRLLSVEAERILKTFRAKTPVLANRNMDRVLQILDMANAFDEQLEFGPFENEQLWAVLDRLMQAGSEDGGNNAVRFVLRHLRKGVKSDLTAVIPLLPVYPAVAVKLYNLLSNEDVNLTTLDDVMRSDPVVAGKILEAANSAYYSPREVIKSVSQAIGYVGLNDARRLLLASSIQPMYASPRHERIWKHSLEAAQVAERIAEISGKVDPADAFLIGLLHDVGKLAISRMSPALNSSLDRLIVKGCESSIAEVVVCGFDHAEAGAEVLRSWKFSKDFISAVRHHHIPERDPSPLASILYLTEYWTDSEEDIPSSARLDLAFERASVSREKLARANFRLNQALSSC